MSRILIPLFVGAFAVACSGGDKGSSREEDTAPDTALDVFFPPDIDTAQPEETTPAETTQPDDTQSEVAIDVDPSVDCDLFGCTCLSNADCLDGLCIEGPDGFTCTKVCSLECPVGYDCLTTTAFGPDPLSVCVPRHVPLCRPCMAHTDCAVAGAREQAYCLPADDPDEGRFCATACGDDLACPAGYDCATVPLPGGAEARLCRPSAGLCQCRPDWSTEPYETTCVVRNDLGACEGVRTCGPEGLLPCDGALAAPETCNGEDDDCNGATDDITPLACTITRGEDSCPGLTACQDGAEICVGRAPEPERCNAIDDDCDGATDEVWDDCAPAACAASGSGFVATGPPSCVEGHCVYQAPEPCGLFTCAADGATCATTCADDTQCVEGAYCSDQGRCVPNATDGSPCLDGSTCDSDHCQNGFCCAAGDCCRQPDDCPAAYRQAPACDNSQSCQGTRRDARCVESVCSLSEPVADDSACDAAVQARDCTPYQPVFCSGLTSQTAPACPTSCDRDEDCVDGFHCDGTCVADAPTGGSCDEDSDCATGHCENGFCCTGGDCCASADDCPDVYRAPSACLDNVTCQGERIDALCLDNRCEGRTVSDDSGCDANVEANDCGPNVSVYCTGAANQNPPVCGTSCTSDDDCEAGFHCDAVCVPDLPDGNFCDEPNDCLTGYCANGICCVSGDCCNLPQDCPSSYSGTPSCDFPTTCQGTRDIAACANHVCGTTVGSPDDTACTQAVLADDCGYFAAVYCTGQPDQPPPVCRTSCDSNQQCDADAFCDNGTCAAKRVNGIACTAADQCASGHCQNGYCCATGDCCAQPSHCPESYASPPACNTPAQCQGSRRDRVCDDNVCGTSAPIDTDEACLASVLALSCDPYQPRYCTGAVTQLAPECPQTCASDAECVDGFHCDGTCVADVADGGACDEDSDCATEHCANGFCCSDGDCCAEASDCPPAYSEAASCFDTITCQGERVDAVCLESRCESEVVQDDSRCDEGVQALDCAPYLPVYCIGGASQEPPTCPASCTADEECRAGFHCDSVCTADLPDGSACDEASDCASDYCDNQICCESGDCCNVAADCPASYTGAAVCDFPASCQGTRDTALCDAKVCATVEDAPNDSACGPGVVANTCGPYPSVSCTGGVDQLAPSCPTSCDSHAKCDLDAFCDVSVCKLKRDDGQACTNGVQCTSGHCQNGFCCASGDCCATAANCNAATYGRPSTCNDATTCSGTRLDPICDDSICALGTTPIDDDSGCSGRERSTCGYYDSVFCSAAQDQGGGSGCPTQCADDGVCDGGAHCEGGICVPDQDVGEACGPDSQCAAGLSCVDGVCCSESCTGTCRACNLADNEGICLNIGSGTDPASECGAVSCGDWYWGFSDKTCYKRANVSAANVGCNGLGACQGPADVCPSAAQGTASSSCHAVCQAPRAGTCTDQLAGACDPTNPGTQECGVGECRRVVDICEGGAPKTCVPGNSVSEICDGKDNDCDGTDDDNLVAPNNTNQLGACAGTKRSCTGTEDGWVDDYSSVPGYGLSESFETTATPAFIDDNCDGIDGNVDAGIFVSLASGSDTSGCGAITSPCRTLGQGLARSVSANKQFIYIQAHTSAYVGPFDLPNGKTLVGGFNSAWVRAARTTSGHTVRISGGVHAASGQSMVFKATGVTATLMDLVIDAPSTSARNGSPGPGKSSYGIHASSSALTLLRVTINQGNGAAGSSGNNGTAASSSSAPSGGNGGAANEFGTCCNDSSRGAGGDAGIHSCGATNTSGGPGGAGGKMDSSCDCTFGICDGNCDATNGLGGSWGFGPSPTLAPGGGGTAGTSNTNCSTCANGAGGHAARCSNGVCDAGETTSSCPADCVAGSYARDGAAGGGGSSGGQLIDGFWYARNGGDGVVGSHGRGGGGGGGSGGCDCGIDSYGAGGGGGGAGGCAAPAAGLRGWGGGGSFGVFGQSSTLTVRHSLFVRGNGGNGGNGGLGRGGQPGGAGGNGGSGAGDSKAGGNGGSGARGGHSGGGGGGAGGYSYGIYRSGGSLTQSNNSFQGGSVGSGGSGGSSPGKSGSNGTSGSLGDFN